jgi:hypothetical protein
MGAFTGINVYLKPHDSFPGAKSRLFGPQNFGAFVGYGVNALNNYLFGMNWESRWGINVGVGLHVGQETQLQPGIVPGVTQLPSTTTVAPTISVIKPSGFITVGFDLNTMKAAISSLFSGGAVSK